MVRVRVKVVLFPDPTHKGRGSVSQARILGRLDEPLMALAKVVFAVPARFEVETAQKVEPQRAIQ